tara:strand:+ start:134 stop:328 length:195 start_codon:yes stop_codon:yes gene_type:complete
MFDKINAFLKSKTLLVTMLVLNIFVFVVGLLLNNVELMFISGCSYATVLLSMYLNREEDEEDKG